MENYNEKLLDYIYKEINIHEEIYKSGVFLDIFKNYKSHVLNNIKNLEINHDQYDLLRNYFNTLISVTLYGKDKGDQPVFGTRLCNDYMKKMFKYFEGTEVLEKMFKKHNVGAEGEFLDDFEDELYDKKNPKGYSHNLKGYIKNGKVDTTPPLFHGEEYYYILVDEKEKTIRNFSCFDLATFYVFRRAYDEFNKDYVEGVVNESQK